MAEEVPTGDRAVFAFCELIALAFMFEGVAAFLNGKSSVLAGCVLAALFFFMVGVRWPKIKLKIKPRLSFWVDRISHDSRYWISAVLLIAFCIAVTVLFYMHALRSDLETYVLPRRLTDKQADDIKEYLSHHEPHAVTVKVNALDEEAREYWGQLSNAIRRTEWNVENSNGDSPPFTLNPGLCIHEQGTGAKSKDPKHDPAVLLREAFRQAHIIVTCGGGQTAGEYKLFVLVGHRRLAIRKDPAGSSLFKLGNWLMRQSKQ